MLHSHPCVRRGGLVVLGLALLAVVPAMLSAQGLRGPGLRGPITIILPPKPVNIANNAGGTFVNCVPDKNFVFTKFCITNSGPFTPKPTPQPPPVPDPGPQILPQFGALGGMSGFQGGQQGFQGGALGGGILGGG